MILRQWWRVASLLAGLVLPPGLAGAATQPVVIKMATPVPERSSWFQILKEMADAWKTASGGRVVLRVYPGGVAGDDVDVVRKMRLGTLQAGVLTAAGLAEIDPAAHALSLPLMYRGDDEASAVVERMRPRLDAAFEARGLVILSWIDAGWIHFFTQKPVATPDDLRALALFTLAGDPRMAEVWRSAGFKPVPMPSSEITRALDAGRLSALGCLPQVAAIARYYHHAKNMTDLPWHLQVGATVINKTAWDQVPAETRPALQQAAGEAGLRLQADIRNGGPRDVAAMRKRGLNVVAVDARARAEWEKLAASLYPKLRGGIVPADAFDEAMRYRDEYRHRAAVPGRP